MTLRNSHPRPGYTVLEMVVVMAILILLAGVVLPSIGAFQSDTRQRAAADMIRGELAVARSRAMEEGRPYRLAISEDGKRLRRAPDVIEFGEMSASSEPSGSSVAVDCAFEYITAEVVVEQETLGSASAAGWVTVAIVLPDGTCRADNTIVAINEEGRSPMYVRVRGLTGTSRVVPNANIIPNGGTR